MSSFLEKLKKGMGVEEEIETEETETEEEPRAQKEPKEPKKSKEPKKPAKIEKIEMKTIEIQEELEEEQKQEKEPILADKEKSWPSLGKAEEGQLAIDVYQTENELVIQSAIAGVRPKDLDISIERDIVSIKGSREKPVKENSDYLTEECFWGAFSREIIIPVETDPQRAMAEMKNGVLTIRIPKIIREKKKKVLVEE